MEALIIGYLKSKTFWASILLALEGVREFITSNPVGGGISVGIAIVIIIIRAFTNTAIPNTPAANVEGVKIKEV